jgi:hypothetical protein
MPHRFCNPSYIGVGPGRFTEQKPRGTGLDARVPSACGHPGEDE